MISRYNGKKFVCLNPLNDGLYDHFNASSGDVLENIRTAALVVKDGTCGYWEKD